MPAISCLSPGLKLILQAEARHIEDAAEKRAYLKLLEALADCSPGVLIGIDAGESERGRRRSDTKRAPSAYNLFIKKCASSKAKGGEGKDFKACTLAWKRQPKTSREGGAE